MSSNHTIFIPATRPAHKPGAHALVYFIPGTRASSSGRRLRHLWPEPARLPRRRPRPFTSTSPPYGLEEQICRAYAGVAEQRIEESARPEENGRPYDFVVVIGHSVGSYITLEIFHRHHHDPSSAPHLRLHHGILLFPTVTHIAKSPSGRRLKALSDRPVLADNAHRVAKALVTPWPRPVLRFLCRALMGFSPEAARVTVEFLKSRDGIWQGLHMGRDEMDVISEDRWDEELWEVFRDAEEHRHRLPKFMFFFAKRDHWVADDVRDEFVRKLQRHATREGPDHKRGGPRLSWSRMARSSTPFARERDNFSPYDPGKERHTRVLDEAKVLAGTMMR
ncbi:unnamed protein product [Parascedosporium putredinis]|uniref:Lipid droplet-associated hydrolase n=1 Tax=Parascedosporium putredinis TaxID=1442378 RepID=A0A9P1GZ48_9PEZI|nr:unnamed protein product [Parascedosporium putredinis]CAI7991392.1 unnamed protein product [Parascedosporium putredinis]